MDPRSPAGGEPETVTHGPKLQGSGERAARTDVALSVVAESYVGVYPLPVRGPVVIGRDPHAAFSIDHPSLSRRHATLDVGAELTLEDLGSKNGTRVGDRALGPGERARIAVGDTVLLGAVRLVVVAWGARESPALLGATALHSRIEYECARARRARRSFAVVRLRVQGAIDAGERAAIVAGVFGPERATAVLVAGDFAAVVGDAEAGHAAKALAEKLRGAIESRGGGLRYGVALHPGDGASPEALLLGAEQRLEGRTARVALAGRSIVVVDPAMVRVHALAARVAVTNVSVLLLGETGSGKEIVAEAIVAASPRRDGPFVRLNCAALSEKLLESELFGHERGAYSGAVQAKAGLLETAHGGTALLDEVGELPLELQAKLLRFLEDGQIRRVGALRARQVDVRVIAATHRDLEGESQRGAFRADLYHRLNGFTLVVPPLRERPAEVAALARQFLDDAAKEQRLAAAPRLSQAALERLTSHPWPGNVRELRNVMRAALILCGDGSTVDVEHLPLQRQGGGGGAAAAGAPRAGRAEAGRPPASRTPYRDPDEARRIAEALERCGGNQAHAAEALGISRTTLLKRMLAFGLRRGHERGDAGPYADPEERRRVVEALAACGGNRSKAAAMLGVSRSTLVMRMLAFGLHAPDDGDG